MLCLLAVPMLFSQACQSAPESLPVKIEVSLPPAPQPPELLPVAWEDRQGGLWLAYGEYRALETNIVRMRAYEEDLRAYIEMQRRILDAAGTTPRTD
jgi:hypothetical protein